MVVLYATFPDQQTAEKICETLVSERLAACANIHSPMRSIYRWDGKLEKSSEVPALLKTKETSLAALAARFKALHPYQVPCLVQLNGDFCWPEFRQWIEDNS